MKKLFLRTMLLTVLMALGGANGARAAVGDVTTNADIDFSNPITDGVVQGTVNSMTLSTTTGDNKFELGYTKDEETETVLGNVLRVGNGSGTVTIPEAQYAGENDIVTITFNMWFGNLIDRYAGFDVKDAEGNRIGGFYVNKYDKITNYDDFAIGIDNVTAFGSGSISNAGICANGNKSTITLTLDYAHKTMQAVVYKANGSTPIIGEVVEMTNTNPVAQFVVKSNYSNKDRRCWFDNLKITTTEGEAPASYNVTVKYQDEAGNIVFDTVNETLEPGSSYTPTYTTTYNPGFYEYTYKEGFEEVTDLDRDRIITIVYTKTLKAAFANYTNGGENTKPFLLDYDEYGDAVKWSSAQPGRYLPAIVKDGDNHYMNIGRIENGNNGCAITSSLGNAIYTARAFTLQFDMKVTGGNNQASSFLVRGSASTDTLLYMNQTAEKSKVWRINKDDNLTVTLDGSTWYTVKVTRLADGSATYLTITDRSSQDNLLYKASIPLVTEGGKGLGSMVFNTARYYTDFSMDNILTRDVVEAEDIPGAATTYTIKYVDENDNAIEGKTDVVLDTYVNEEVSATTGQLATFVIGETQYVYVSGNDPIIAVAEAANNVITLKFKAVNKVTYAVKAVAGETELATIIEGSDFPGTEISYSYSQYLAKDGVLYKSVKQDGGTWWGKTFTLDETAYTATISYAAEGTTGIVFCKEAEDINGLAKVTSGNTPFRASNMAGAYATEATTITTLAPGMYKILGACYGSGSVIFNITAGEATVFTVTTAGNPTHTTGEEFTLTAATDIVLATGGNGGSSPKVMDYIIIQKTGEYEGAADITSTVLLNANFDSNANSWSLSGMNWADGSAKIDGGFVETWVDSANPLEGHRYVKQTIFGLPEGTYTFTAHVNAVRQGQDNLTIEGVNLFANDDKTACSGAWSLDNTVSVTTKLSGTNTLELGLDIENTNANWVAIDKLTLTCEDKTLSEWTAARTAFLPATGTYYLKNVGTGKWLAAGASWGSQAIVNETGLDYVATLNDGKYTFDSKVSNGGDNHFLGSGLYNDAAAFEWTGIKVSDGVYALQNDAGYLAIDGTTAAISAELTDAAKWQFVTREERIAAMADATEENPVNATFLIADANFNRNDTRLSSWSMTASNQNLAGGDNTNFCAESFHSTFTLSQTLTGVPNGYYKMTAQGFYRQDGSDNDNLPYFYINDGRRTFPVKTGTENSMTDASASFTAGSYTIDPIDVTVADHTITLGAKLESNTALWCIFDNFQLTYLGGIDLSEYISAYTTALASAKEIAAGNDKMLTTTLTALNTAITTYDDGKVATDDQEALETAIAALNEAINAANTSILAYRNAKAALDGMKNVLDGTNFYTTEAYEAYAYETKLAAYNEGTLANDVASALINPENTTGWRAANDIDDLLMSAWDETVENWGSYHVNTWSNEGDSDGSAFKVPFIEYWTGDGDALAAKTMTATLSGLENGLYKVSAWVRVRAKNGIAATAATGITMQVNNGDPVDVTEGSQVGETQFTLATYEAEGLVRKGTLTFSFAVADGNNISWLSFKNVKYTKVRDLNDDEIFIAATADDYAALNEAIDGHVIGFAKDEYAPYNNVAVLATLTAAKAIDQNDDNEQSTVQAATAALNEADWVVNTEEVNAFYDGSFASTYSHDGNVMPIGWHGVGNHDNATDVRLMWNYEGNPGLNAASNKQALFAKFTAIYGNETGYTLPLKAGVYELRFIYSGWNEDGEREVRLYSGSNNAEVLPTANVKAKDNQGHTTAESWQTYTAKVVVPADGDYIFSLYRENTTNQNQIAVSDITMFSVPESSATLAVTAAKYGTFVAPFVVTMPEGVIAYTVTEGDGSQLTLTAKATEGVELPANTPVVVYSESVVSETFQGYSLATADSYQDGALVGTYADIEAPNGSYILQNQSGKVGFFRVDTSVATPKVKANRAYLTSASGARASFFFEDAILGIDAIELLTSGEAQVFDVNGVQQPRLKKGLNILRAKDGRTTKVMVK